MELMQLEMFLAVVEERSVNRAAERVCRTQPAVSIALRKLEQEFGYSLLHRPRRGAYRLTQAGELMYELAAQMVGLRNEAISALRGPTLAMPGRIVLGLEGADHAARIAPALETFRKQNLGVRVELCLDNANRLLSDLADRKLDLLVVSTSPSVARMNPTLLADPMDLGKGAPIWLVHPRMFTCDAAKRFAELLLSRGANEEDARGTRKSKQPATLRSSNVA